MKIAVCTPYHGDVTAAFAYSLGKMLLATAQTEIQFNGEIVRPQVELFFVAPPPKPRGPYKKRTA